MNSTDAISALQVLVETFKGQIAQLQGGIDAITTAQALLTTGYQTDQARIDAATTDLQTQLDDATATLSAIDPAVISDAKVHLVNTTAPMTLETNSATAVPTITDPTTADATIAQ
jgi:hypothetical protein